MANSRKQPPQSTHKIDSKHVAKPSHWREIHDPRTGRLILCRPAGGPAGCFVHTPWWHCVFHDPYERVNFWSHFIPGVVLVGIMIAASTGLIPGGAALATFAVCSSLTHFLSALTHVYPDDHFLEKCDHIGIVATIVGTPMTALMAQEHGHLPQPLLGIAVLLLVAAFLKPLYRVLGFVSGGALLVRFMFVVVLYGAQLLDELFITELVLYVLGAYFFLRNGGHNRLVGFTDHHMLHYFVTLASAIHIYYVLRLI